ncbi:MAG TPA: hypothetical protein VFR68_11315 [Candidatus Dormibacteraeota bacterium]|nr:hypothetical protein [Candidatus Dormibacteraeota bacterium]
MADSYEREVVREDTAAGQPVTPARPVTTTSSRTAVYREGSYNSRAVAAVWWIVGFIDTLIAIRFVLKLFGANTGASFVRFMYDVTWPFVAPFHGIFNTAQEGRSILEPESIVAALIYLLIGWGLVSLIRIVGRPSRTTTVVD